MVMALWETGVTWAPPSGSDVNGAQEHVAQNFAKWCCRVARAIRRHKDAEGTQIARTRSGSEKRKHDLTEQEENCRRERKRARSCYHYALTLQAEIRSGYQRSWDELTGYEQWYVYELENGNLRQAVIDAESKCSPVAAEPFHVGDDD